LRTESSNGRKRFLRATAIGRAFIPGRSLRPRARPAPA
jgi:hypothetical protein